LTTCVEDLKYKICIETDNIFCILNNKNKIKCFEKDTNKSNSSNYKKIFVTIDMENFYNNINKINIDMLKIEEELYRIINSSHNNQIAIIKTHMKNFNNNKTILEDYSKYRNKLSDKIISISSKLKAVSIKELELTRQIKDETSANITTNLKQNDIKAEIIKIQDLKKEAMDILIKLKSNYDNYILNFENVLIENIKLLKQVNDNFNQLFQ
jgi:hypothetical protein